MRGSQYRIAPDNEIQDPNQAVVIRGKVSQTVSLSLSHNSERSPPEILDRNCAGVAGAVVDVWYAGGAETREEIVITSHLRSQFQITPSGPVSSSTEEKSKPPR